jgi:hypothetical protein
VQAVEMTRNDRAWKSQVRDFHITHRLDGEQLIHNTSSPIAAITAASKQ